MPKTLVLFLWLLATVGVTFVANTAVELVDLQVFPDRERIEVLSLSEPQSNESFSELSTTTVLAPTTTLPLTSTTVLEPESVNETESEESFKEEEVLEEINSESNENEISPTTTFLPIIEEKTLENELFIEKDDLVKDGENTEIVSVTTSQPPETVVTTSTTSTTTTTVPIAEIPVVFETLGTESFDLRVGSEYEIELIAELKGAISLISHVEKLPVGLKIDEKGVLTGKPLESGLFELELSLTQDNGNILQKTILLVINEFRVISARGGSVTVVISGESVSFFSALNSSGFESPDLIKAGPLMVDVAFYPLTGDETSWVRCEANEVVTCSSG